VQPNNPFEIGKTNSTEKGEEPLRIRKTLDFFRNSAILLSVGLKTIAQAMVGCPMLLIPTAVEEKLPKGSSYPLGAEAIGSAKPWFGWRDGFWVSRWRKRWGVRGLIACFEVYLLFKLCHWRSYHTNRQ
jgi:hypothetical protein